MRERRGGHRQPRRAPEAHARLPRHARAAGGHGRGGRGQEGPIVVAEGNGRGRRGGGSGAPASPRHHRRGVHAGRNFDNAAAAGGYAPPGSRRHGGGQVSPFAYHAAASGRGRRGGDGAPGSPRHHHRGGGQAGPTFADHAASRGRGRRRFGGDSTPGSPRHGGGQASHFADHAASPGRRCGKWGRGMDSAPASAPPNHGGHGAARGLWSESCVAPSASDQGARSRGGWDSPPFVGGGARGVGVDLELQARGGGNQTPPRPPRADRHRQVWVPVLSAANANLDVRFWMPFVHDGRSLEQFVYIAGDLVHGVGEALLNGGGDVWVDGAAAPGWLRELVAHVGHDLPGSMIIACVREPQGAAVGAGPQPGGHQLSMFPIHLRRRVVRQLFCRGGGDQGAAVAGAAGAADAPRPPAQRQRGAGAVGGGRHQQQPGRRRIRRERNAQRAALNNGGAQAPARAAAGVPAQADADLSPDNKRLQSLYSSMLKKQELIQGMLQGLRGLEECAKAQAESPNRETIRLNVDMILSQIDSYDRVDAEATDLRTQLEHPVPRPPELDRHPRDDLPPSVTRRMARRDQ